jgi:hypothetical protein
MGIWRVDEGQFHPIPGLDSNFVIIGWTQDGASVYVAPRRKGIRASTSVKVFRANVQTGQMEPWKTFGDATGAGVSSIAAPHLSRDGSAYAYIYTRVLSEAYVVQGLR